jgi:hypothetical protein
MQLLNGGDPIDIGGGVGTLCCHHHNRERWFGKAADQSGDDWAADRLVAYQAISGNGVYGADPGDEAKLLGRNDTPVLAGKTKFDLHRILLVNVSSSTEYKLRLAYGGGTLAEATAAGDYTELMVKFDPLAPAQSAGMPFNLQMPKLDASTKVWCQCWNATDNATVDFYVGLHEYDE